MVVVVVEEEEEVVVVVEEEEEGRQGERRCGAKGGEDEVRDEMRSTERRPDARSSEYAAWWAMGAMSGCLTFSQMFPTISMHVRRRSR